MLAHIYDPIARRVIDGTVIVKEGRIAAIQPATAPLPADAPCILPGLVDAHIHIESTMMLPENLADAVVRHGTTALVCAPHEIANVLGPEGVYYMIDHARLTPLHIAMGAPSCVPSTGFETAGAVIDHSGIEALMSHPGISFLAEVMAVPSVLGHEPDMMAKLAAAQHCGKPIDGHAPGVSGDDLAAYRAAGITTNHECTTLDEGRENIRQGIKVLIREGSAARDFDALMPLIAESPDSVMLCSDDKHPDDLLAGHINLLVQRALRAGLSIWDILQAASVNPVRHYHLGMGLLQVGDSADFIVIDSLDNFQVQATCLRGTCYDALQIQDAGFKMQDSGCRMLPNNFHARSITAEALRIPAQQGPVRCIVAHDGSLLTDELPATPRCENGLLLADTRQDLLKIVVYNRYDKDARPAIGFIHGFGLREGAFASTVAHDSHNIIAVGTSDETLTAVINAIVGMQGGMAVCDGSLHIQQLPLPVAGLMSPLPIQQVADAYSALNRQIAQMGCPFHAPFMTLGFMALPVIPALKMTDRGLFSYATFSHCPLQGE